MVGRRTLISIVATMAGAVAAALIVGRVLRPAPMGLPPPPPPEPAPAPAPGTAVAVDVDAVPIATPDWLVAVGFAEHAPDGVAHPPVAIGDRVLIAGARVGYVALDRARGAVAWRRPGGGPRLSAPLVRSPHDVVLVHACLDPIGLPPDEDAPACFERLDPLDIAVRAAGPLRAPRAEVGTCAIAGVAPWTLRAAGAELLAARGDCAFQFALPDARARRVAAPADSSPAPDDLDGPGGPDADCAVAVDGTPWCQRVGGGRSTVELAGVALPGLLAITAAHDDRGVTAVVVRVDGTLRNDVLYLLRGGAVVWRWPLPAPLDGLGRNAVMGLSVSAAGVFLHFEGERVAAFTAP